MNQLNTAQSLNPIFKPVVKEAVRFFSHKLESLPEEKITELANHFLNLSALLTDTSKTSDDVVQYIRNMVTNDVKV